MKSTMQKKLIPVNEALLKELTTETKETIATGCIPFQKRKFTHIDFWNIQRQGKLSITRRSKSMSL